LQGQRTRHGQAHDACADDDGVDLFDVAHSVCFLIRL
jgi:hypothetical protein